MTYSTCPNCGIRIGSRDGTGPARCPRCLARKGFSVDLIQAVRRELVGTARYRPSRGA